MLKRIVLLALLTLSVSACSSWVYRIDIPQGNYLDADDVAKLRVGMTKAQVQYVLGTPVVSDAFSDDAWYFVYSMKPGKGSKEFKKSLVLRFDNQGNLKTFDGDFEIHEEFHTPL